jgi:hypothetical protein
MTRILIVLGVLALVPLSTIAQTADTTVSAVLVNKSPADAPFIFEGSIKCSEWVEGDQLRSKGEGSVDVINTSHRQIVAWAAKTNVACLHALPKNMLEVRDHFFRDHSLPEESWKIEPGFNEGTKRAAYGKQQDPHDVLLSAAPDPVFTVELTFVQFDDGSIWGSRDVFSQVESGRVVTQKFLEHLSNESRDETTFRAALAEDQAPESLAGNIATQLRGIEQKSGIDAAIDKVRDALEAAERRRASGRF